MLFAFFQLGMAQLQTYYVAPYLTDSNYTVAQDSHAVIWNSSASNGKLLLFIGGTNSETNKYLVLRRYAADLGFHVINLSYPNTVAAATLASSSDSLAFDHFRQELCYGTPLSGAVAVDSLNSITTRLKKLLIYLVTNHASEIWGNYLLANGDIFWPDIAIAGHSQGSGHASYLGKFEEADRVLMFSGPNDYSTFFSNYAHWIGQPGITPVPNQYVYLSLNDEVVDFSKQYTDIGGLGMLVNDDTTLVDNSMVPFGNSHCLYTTQSPGFALLHHNVPIKNSALNKQVWEYMLTDVALLNLGEPTYFSSNLQVFPNPVTSVLHVEWKGKGSKKDYKIYDLNGQLIQSGPLSMGNETIIEIARLPVGVYLLKVGNEVLRFAKQ